MFGERVVERLDVHAGALAELLEARAPRTGCAGPWRDRGNRSAARCRPRRPLSYSCAHRVGDREQIGLLARIVVVAEEQRDDARRGRAHERVGPARGRERGLEIVDVGARRRRIAHADRSVAGRRLAARSAGIAEHALGEIGEVGEILVHEGVAGAAEAGEPVLDVGGIARLRHLAVVDEIDAGLDLLAHHLGDRRAHARRQRRAIDRHALLLGVHHPDEVVGPRQAAGMGGEEALGAAAHRPLSARTGRLQRPAGWGAREGTT